MNTTNWWSVFLHGVASIVVVAVPMAMTGLPQQLSTLTVAALLGMVMKWAHLYLAA